MKYLLCLLLLSGSASADFYLKVGAGYKLIETDHITMTTGEKVYFDTGGKISARIEIGDQRGRWSYGLSHHSQWLEGWPVNDSDESQKTEVFIDYTFF